MWHQDPIDGSEVGEVWGGERKLVVGGVTGLEKRTLTGMVVEPLFSPSITGRLTKPTSNLPTKGPPFLPPPLHCVLKGQRNFFAC